MKNRYQLFGALFALSAQVATAQPITGEHDLKTGSSFLACRKDPSAHTSGVCNIGVGMYAVGVVNGIRSAKMGANPGIAGCVPDAVLTPNTMAAVVAGQLAGMPLVQHMPLSVGVNIALVGAFPCLSN